MARNRATHSFEYNVICDVCGWKLKSSEVQQRWDGIRVCAKDWEPRHPLDFYTTKNDVHLLPFTRPEAADTYLSVTSNTATNVDPTAAPASTGLYWFNTKTGSTFKSTGTSTVADWVRINQ